MKWTLMFCAALGALLCVLFVLVGKLDVAEHNGEVALACAFGVALLNRLDARES